MLFFEQQQQRRRFDDDKEIPSQLLHIPFSSNLLDWSRQSANQPIYRIMRKNAALFARRKRSGSADSAELLEHQSGHEPSDPDAFTASHDNLNYKDGDGDQDREEEGEDHTHKSPSHAWKTCNIRVLRRVVHSEVGCALEAVVAFVIIGLFIAYVCLHHHHRKVVFHVLHDPIGHGKALKGRSGFRHHFFTNYPKSVTVVMPSVVLPEKRTRRLNSISETWGPNARAIYVVHNTTEFPDAAKHAVIGDGHPKPQDPYSYPQLLLVPPTITDKDGVPRLIYVIQSVYEKVNPDFAFFVNDHTFVIPEHLCKYLEDKDPSKDLNAGHALKTDNYVFNSGAAGYVLSRETMRRLVDQWKADDPLCTGKDAAKWLQGNPALLTTKCMMEKLNVHAIDTRSHGRWHRFHAFPLTRSVSGDVDGWYKNKHEVRTMHRVEVKLK